MKLQFEIPNTPFALKLLSELYAKLSDHKDLETDVPIKTTEKKRRLKSVSTTTTTFPQLVTGITEKSISEEELKSALKTVGVESFPGLAAEPDLIPVVAGMLGL